MRVCGSYCCCLLCGSGGSSVAVAQGFQFRELSNKGKGKGRAACVTRVYSLRLIAIAVDHSNVY